MLLRCLIIFTAAVVLPASSEPLPEGSFVDLVVVPLGPVPLAEFEADTPPPPSGKPGEKPAAADTSGSGGGSGVRVKAQDPEEIPPRAVFLAKGKDKYLQIPCFFNAVSTPVRVPVSDSSLVFHLRSPKNPTELPALKPVTLTAQPGGRVLALLTRPAGEKRWTQPTLTLIPLPGPATARLVVVNGSASLSCGAVLAGTDKRLIPPLRHHAWSPSPAAADQPAAVALAVADEARGFLPPFYQDNLPLPANTTTLLIAYEVTATESFRRAKYIIGVLQPDDFRPAMPYPDD